MSQPDRQHWLRSEAELFRLLVENVRDYAIFATDPHGRVQGWNSGAERLLGYREEEIVGRSADLFFTPEDVRAGVPQREMGRAIEGGRGGDDRWHVRKDGSRFWCTDFITPLRDESGTVRGFAKVVRDRTEWKRAEEAAGVGERLAAFERAVGHAIAHGTSLRETLTRCAEATVCHLGVALARIWTLNEPDGVLELQASAGLYTHTDGPHGRIRVGQFKIGRIAQERTPHLTNSVVGDPQVHDQEWARREGLVAFAGYPLVVEGLVVGVVAAFARHPLADATLRAMAAVASEIALAVLRRRAEEALRASEERFRRLSESGFVSIAFFTPDGHITDANDAFLRLTGHGREDLTAGRVRWDRLTPPEWLPRTRQAVREFEATGRISPYEKEYFRRDGTRFWGLFGGARLEGRAEGVAFVLDVTERKRAEDAVRHSEERFRSLMDQAPFSIQVFSPDGRTIRVNRAWEELWGVRFEQIGGYNVLDDRQLEAKGILPYVRRGFAGETTRIPAIQYNPNETIPGVTAQDDPRRWLAAVIYPIKDADGWVQEVVLIHEDITARHRAETALRESEERFRSLAEGMPHCVWVTDPQGVNHYQNRVWYEYTGTPPGSGHGQDWLALYHPDDRPHLSAEWAMALETDGAHEYDVEVRIRRHDGEYRWFRVKGSPIRDAAGATVRWVGTCTDIHEQRRLLDALQEADQRKDEFLATLAHELRNPLAPIRNGLQIMKLAGGDAKTAERCCVMMGRQVEQMAHLIDDLMDVSRISRGKVALQKARMPLAQAVGDAIETSRPLIERQGHELVLAVPDEPIFVDADATRLTQVFANLLNNAAKYTEPGGHIRLRVVRDGGEVVVSVEDTGVGIPADMLPRVFDMFTQVDRSLEKSQGGLGIGLHIVKRLVEMHGGRIEARSAEYGTGSTFVVRLPAAPSVIADPAGDGVERAAPPARRILVVDDNRDGAESLAEMLAVMGNETQTAHDGLEAVMVAETFRPDVILMDIGMPKLNGYDACRRIREQPWGKTVVVIAQTGWGQDEDRKKSHEAGFNFHLVKPIDPAVLEGVLAGVNGPHG